MEAIEKVLKGLVVRGPDGARVFATIFLRKVCALFAFRGRCGTTSTASRRKSSGVPAAQGYGGGSMA